MTKNHIIFNYRLIDDTLLHLVDVSQSPVNAFPSPVNAFPSPVDISRASVDTFLTPVNICRTPVNVFLSPVNTCRSPVNVRRTAVDTCRIPVDIRQIPVNICRGLAEYLQYEKYLLKSIIDIKILIKLLNEENKGLTKQEKQSAGTKPAVESD